MNEKTRVKRVTRGYFVGPAAPLSIKRAATATVPEDRIRKALDEDEPKDLRAWEVAEMISGALATDRDAALAWLEDLFHLREQGVAMVLRPTARPSPSLTVDALQVGAAAGQLQAVVAERIADGVVDPEDARAIGLAAREVERKAAEVEVIAEAVPSPQVALKLVAGGRR